MDPASGKLFGLTGNREPECDAPTFVAPSLEPDFSRWYTLQWLECHGFQPCDEAPAMPQEPTD